MRFEPETMNIPESMFQEYFVFEPKDHVLVSNYLSRKVRGEALPFEDYVKEMDSHDVYGAGKQRWEIFAMHAQRQDSKAVYLFTTTPHVHMENGSYSSNDFGAWKVEDNGNSVLVEDHRHGNQVG